jgi:hypothetical protein
MKHLINLFLLLLPFITITAQKTIEKGYVKIVVTEASSEDPATAKNLQMMKESVTEVHFVEGKYKTSTAIMGGLASLKNIVDLKTNNIDMLLEVMGNKMWVKTDTEKAKSNPAGRDMSDFEVDYDKSQTKSILGYDTYRTTITGPNGLTIEGWITEAIKTDASIIQGMQDLKLQGFPLEFSIIKPGNRLTFSATVVSETVEDSEFIFDPTLYVKMTLAELSEFMGAMGVGLGI